MAARKSLGGKPTPYGERFFARKNEGSYRSARAVLPVVFDLIRPRSIVDVGCGSGTWLKAADELGAHDYLGFDGSRPKQLYIPEQRFAVADLTRTLSATRRFDLAFCCEVAEHLPAVSSESLIATLVAFSDVVLFSAAIPGQGGTHHLNEQWPAYWQQLFAARSYSAYDCLRHRIWREENIEWWYRQNLVLYVADATASRYTLPPRTEEVLALVHPELYARKLGKRVVKNFLRSTRKALRRITGQES